MATKQDSGRISARIDPKLKAEGDALLSELGYTPSTLITVLYKALVRNKAIPRDMTTLDPLDIATAKAHEQIARGEYDEFPDLDAFRKDLYSNDQ